MARPKVPLISKRKTLEVALHIIDTEGLDALSIRRLAIELNVHGASLYHHFANKDEILIGAASLALRNVRAPVEDAGDWREWLIGNAVGFRATLREHPSLIPVLMRRRALGIGRAEQDASMAALERQGVPKDRVVPVFETLEQLAIGMILHETATTEASANGLADTPPTLVALTRASAFSSDEVFLIAANATIDALISAKPTRKRPARAKSKN